MVPSRFARIWSQARDRAAPDSGHARDVAACFFQHLEAVTEGERNALKNSKGQIRTAIRACNSGKAGARVRIIVWCPFPRKIRQEGDPGRTTVALVMEASPLLLERCHVRTGDF